MASSIDAFRKSLSGAAAKEGAYGERVSKNELEKALAPMQADGQVDGFEKDAVKVALANLSLTAGAKEVAVEFLATVSADPNSLANQLPADWREALKDELDKPYFKELEGFLRDERTRANIEPPPDKVFAALHRTPLDQVKVVLLGQDPYPTKGNATGLSFSIPEGKPIPGSLRNMFKVMNADVGAPIPNHGNLEAWADQGVLLLNTVLTVREGEPNSHKGHGWETFTKAILEVVNKKADPVAFLLLGKQAQQVAAQVDTTKHAIVAAPHPSPVTPGNPFGQSRPYSAINALLEKAGRGPIDWTIPAR